MKSMRIPPRRVTLRRRKPDSNLRSRITRPSPQPLYSPDLPTDGRVDQCSFRDASHMASRSFWIARSAPSPERDQKFESSFVQRRVRCELRFREGSGHWPSFSVRSRDQPASL
jgi:hypothetical protein